MKNKKRVSEKRILKIKSRIKIAKKRIERIEIFDVDKETYAKMEKLYMAHFGRFPWDFWRLI